MNSEKIFATMQALIAEQFALDAEEITMEQIAAAADSFNYEFVCGISRRVPRIYSRGGKTVHSVHYLLDT